MNVECGSLNQLWSDILIEEFVRQNVTEFIVSPGSRSTPLTLAVAQHKKTDSCVCFDERGAAFRAIGYARATGKAAVLICTSGTAVVNYFPAVAEASNDNLPLIILSADRPEELQNCGANQTLNQKNIFGSFVRESIEMPAPSEEVKPTYILDTVASALSSAYGKEIGPVHLNCPFREPLAPPDEKINFQRWTAPIKDWVNSAQPFKTIPEVNLSLEKSIVDKIGKVINSNARGIIIAGRLNSIDEAEAVSRISSKLQWPLLPDIQSQLRLNASEENRFSYYDLVLNAKDTLDQVDCVLHIGNQLTSKRLQQALKRINPTRYIQITSGSRQIDPDEIVTEHHQADLKTFCTLLTSVVDKTNNYFDFSKENDQVYAFLAERLDSQDEVSELSIARIISQTIEENSALFLASSLPIRLFDSYADRSESSVIVGANRGVSGIDGTVASAVGFAEGYDYPTTLVIGDLALLHDLNSLAMLKDLKQSLTIVVINNGGGGIFSLLPVARQKEYFEKFFAAAHTLDFESAAKMFSIEYQNPKTNSEFRTVYKEFHQADGSSIIEIKTNRDKTASLINEINQLVADKLS